MRRRIPGNIMGGFLFVGLYIILPPSFIPFLGILGGIGVGFSTTYIWQSAFNSLGAISIAAGLLGFPQAVFFRVLNNMLGAVYGFISVSYTHLDVYKRQAYYRPHTSLRLSVASVINDFVFCRPPLRCKINDITLSLTKVSH